MSDLTSKQDLLASLRDYGTVAGKRMSVQDRACHAAADEIDRLTAENRALREDAERNEARLKYWFVNAVWTGDDMEDDAADELLTEAFMCDSFDDFKNLISAALEGVKP